MKDIAAEAAYHLAVLLWFAASLVLLAACFALLAGHRSAPSFHTPSGSAVCHPARRAAA